MLSQLHVKPAAEPPSPAAEPLAARQQTDTAPGLRAWSCKRR